MSLILHSSSLNISQSLLKKTVGPWQNLVKTNLNKLHSYMQMFLTIITGWKCFDNLQSFRLSLQPSSVWRHLWMVLETTWNANRFLRLPPLHWWSPLRSPSTSPLWCYSRSGVDCIVLRLCWVKVLRPGCVLPPSLLFQTICAPPPVSSYSPTWWYGRGCRCVCISRPLMWWNSVSYVLQISGKGEGEGAQSEESVSVPGCP